MQSSKAANCARSIRTAVTVLLLWTGLGWAAPAADHSPAPDAAAEVLSGKLYRPSPNALRDVNAARQRAAESGRLLLVIMGADWCHDSRALASRIHQAPLKSLIEARYETVFVDVGYLEHGREVITRIGPPVYYATPTVLIVDPRNGDLVNAGNRHQWGNAEKIGMAESVSYFESMAEAAARSAEHDAEVSPTLLELRADIDAFERQQAERLYAAYAVLRPMLRAYDAGRFADFSEDYWNEVRDFRMNLAREIDALHREAARRVGAGETQVVLDYPEYPPLSSETAARQ